MDYLKEFENCMLCEHRCGVNRITGELGVCRMGLPQVASRTLHPAPPESYTVFMAGCNLKCLNCQNWRISQYPDNGKRVDGWIEPDVLAVECVGALNSHRAKNMGADRLFFSGGEPTISLPYIERVVAEARSMEPGLKVNFDTNGFMTEASLERILGFADSFTYDIKAFFDDTHKALTGAPVAPVLRNAKTLIEKALDRIWEIRVTVVPGINDEDIEPLCEFLAGLSPDVPVNFLAFRPNFVLDSHPGASRGLLTLCVDTAMAAGLTNVVWTGMPGLPGTPCGPTAEMLSIYEHRGAAAAAACVAAVGCPTHPRQCLECKLNRECPVKRHEPRAANQPG